MCIQGIEEAIRHCAFKRIRIKNKDKEKDMYANTHASILKSNIYITLYSNSVA